LIDIINTEYENQHTSLTECHGPWNSVLGSGGQKREGVRGDRSLP